nr:hypothetical protein [Kofleriaceae bacterium]
MLRTLALALTLAACAVDAPPPAEHASAPAAPAITPQSAAAPDACTALMTHARTCTDAFIPALVDARARHDKPAGIAQQVAADRNGVIAAAMTEWQTDSTDDAIAKTCAKAAAVEAPDCSAAADCTAFVQCAMPAFERRL